MKVADIIQRFWHERLSRPFRLAYNEYGQGDTPVLLLHGIATDGRFWEPLLDVLPTDQYRIIVPDLLGHGTSPKPNYITYSSDDQASAVMALCQRLGLTQCIVVGHSMGCLVASRIATMQPGLVSKLLLYEPPLFADVPEFRTHSRRKAFYFNMYERIAKKPEGTVTMARIVARVAKNWTNFLESDQAWLPIERSLRNNIMQQRGYEELRDTAIATDIVHGRFDVVVTRASLKKMLQHNKNVRFYKTTDNHGLSRSGARYLARLIASPKQMDDTKPTISDKVRALQSRRQVTKARKEKQ